jgi:glycosyltransferase 2 family protein
MWKTLLKWLISLAIGAAFIWYAGKNWPLARVFQGQPTLVGSVFLMVPDGLRDDSPMVAVGAASGPSAFSAAVVAAGGWSIDLWSLLPYFTILSLIHFSRVLRWSFLLRPIARFDFWELNRVGAVGYMAMFVFPFRLGELVRPYLLRQRHRGKIRMTEGLAVIVVERAVDGMMVSLLLFLVLFFMPRAHIESYERVRIGAYVALLVFLGVVTMLGVMFASRRHLMSFLERFGLLTGTPLGQRVLSITRAFLSALQVLPNARTFLTFIGITAVYWCLVALGYNVLSEGFDLGLPILGSMAMMATSVVGMMIPNSPANVGSFWVFFLLPLGLYIGDRADNTQAVAYALIAWGGALLQYLIFSGYFLARRAVSFDNVIHARIEE